MYEDRLTTREIRAAYRSARWLVDVFKAGAFDAESEEIRRDVDQFTAALAQKADLSVQLRTKCEQLSLEVRQVMPAPEADAPAAGPACSIEIVSVEVGPCILCCGEVGRGLIGWQWWPEPGPLCDECLSFLDLDLATMLVLIQRAREIARGGLPDIKKTFALLDLGRGYARATADAWPARFVAVEETLPAIVHLAEAMLGSDWLSDLQSNSDGGAD